MKSGYLKDIDETAHDLAASLKREGMNEQADILAQVMLDVYLANTFIDADAKEIAGAYSIVDKLLKQWEGLPELVDKEQMSELKNRMISLSVKKALCILEFQKTESNSEANRELILNLYG